MNLRDLEYVEAVARFRSFSKAAEACNVSQPALSNQVKKLEKELEGEIFERKPNSVCLTLLGERVITSARIILIEKQKIIDAAIEYRDPTTLPLRVGMPPTLAPFIMHYLIAKVKSEYAAMEIVILERSVAELHTMMDERLVDIIIMPETCYEGKQNFTNLFNEPMFIAMHKDHALAQYDSLSLDDIPIDQFAPLSHPLGYKGEGDSIHNHTPLSQKLAIQVNSNNLATLCRHIASSLDCTLLPALAVQTYKNEGWPLEFRPLRNKNMTRNIGVVSRLNCPRKPILNTLHAAITNDIPIGAIIYEPDLGSCKAAL